MNLKQSLLQTPRECSGPRSSNRFDFQKNWTLCKLLETHSKNNDYLLILDLHEDVIILDSSVNPKKASFFQVKTRQTGCWKLSDLLRKRKSKNKTQSILAKLYYNKIIFKNNVNDLNFVSNIYCKINLKVKTKKAENQRMICVNEFDDKDKNKLIDKISGELSIPQSQIKEDIIFFVLSDLGINSHSETTMGKLSNFLETQIPGCNYKLGVVYKSLFDEIRKKTNEELSCNSFNELLKYKSISKNNFDEILNIIIASFSSDIWIDVYHALTSENFPLYERRDIKNAWNKYSIDRMDPNNMILKKLRQKIKQIINIFQSKEIKNCKELLEKTLNKYSEVKTEEEEIYNQNYIKAITLMEYFVNE